MVWSISFFAVVCACYLLRELGVVKGVAADLLKDFVDVSPAVILLPFCGFKSALFLMSCLIANEFIYDNIFIGAGVFAAGYVSASLFSVWGVLNLDKIYISGVTAIAAIVPLLAVYKGELKLKIGAGIYGGLTIPVILYAFYVTLNPGFLALAIGDALLLVGEMLKENKAVRIVSDCFYFLGTCFVPLSLVGGWL